MNKKYIRIGEIPPTEEPRIYNGDAIVGIEKGVSVYEAIEYDGKWRIIMPLPFKEGQGTTYECLVQNTTECRYKIEKPTQVYLVSGDEVGIGSDNEPLLKNIKVLDNITEQFRV
jgi:hypothetical protein